MRSLTMAQAINEALRNEMRIQPEIVLLGQDIGVYGGTFGVYKGLFEEFGPDRVRDGPLCESATVGFGIGLAMMGMRSVVELEFIDFSTLALDQIVNQAAKMHYFYGGQVCVPMVVRTPIVSRIGMGPQHSQSLEAWFMHIPGLRVAIPSNAYDAKGLMTTSLREPNPVIFIENVKLYSTKADVPEEDYAIPFGKARVLTEGTDVTVVAISGTVPEALAAAEELSRDGISVEVLDPRTLAPLDTEGIAASLRKTGRMVITHDAYQTCGVAAEISQRMMETAFDYLDAPISRVTGLDVPIPSGPLHMAVLPDRHRIGAAVRTLLNLDGTP
jgi:acetoin:2,6-dichlorophenolindophenol oxidoreductase subunit beta